MDKRKATTSVRLAVSIAACILGVFTCVAANGDQPIKPTKVPTPAAWRIRSYQWISKHQVILLFDKAPGYDIRFRFDLTTNRSGPFGNDALWRYSDNDEHKLWAISPDGARILGGDYEYQRTISHTDDPATNLLPPGPSTLATILRWSPDSTGWMEALPSGYDTSVTFVSCPDLPASARRPGGSGIGRIIRSDYTIRGTPLIAGLSAPNTVIAAYKRSTYASKESWIAMSMRPVGTSKIMASWLLTIPDMIELRSGDVSPDNGRTVWLAACAASPHDVKVPQKDSVAAEIWVNDADGKHLTKVTRISVPGVVAGEIIAPFDHHFDPLPSEVRWVPGGDKVSYLWKGRLWIVDVPWRAGAQK